MCISMWSSIETRLRKCPDDIDRKAFNLKIDIEPIQISICKINNHHHSKK
jgi:hypothetical protein